jgi:hypothetical protein
MLAIRDPPMPGNLRAYRIVYGDREDRQALSESADVFSCAQPDVQQAFRLTA